MRRKVINVMMRLFVALAFGLTGCGGGGSSSANPNGGGTVTNDPPVVAKPNTIAATVQLDLPQGSSLASEQIAVSTFFGSKTTAKIVAAGIQQSSITATNTNKPQILIVSDSQKNPLFFSFFSNMSSANSVAKTVAGTVAQPKITINGDSIAKSLLWLNPIVISLPRDNKTEFMSKVITIGQYSQLVKMIDDLLLSDPKKIFDPIAHPEIGTLAFEVVKNTFIALQSNTTVTKIVAKSTRKDVGSTDNTYVTDKPGKFISFMNPKMISYGIEIRDNNNALEIRDLALGKSGVVQVKWQWPLLSTGKWTWPVSVSTSPEESSLITLNDGKHSIYMTKGNDFSSPNYYTPWIPELDNSLQLNGANVNGTALWMNMYTILDMVIDAVTGSSILEHDIKGVSKKFLKPLAKALNNIKNVELYANALQSGPVDAISATVDFVIDNWPVISQIIWAEVGPDSIDFMRFAKTLLNNSARVFKLVDAANVEIPFLTDLAFATNTLNYCVESSGGILSQCSGTKPLLPPVAEIDTSTKTIYVNDTVVFDASASSDPQGESLTYQFDVLGNGTWTPESSSSSTSYKFTSPGGPYTAKVQVKNSDGLTSNKSYYYTVTAIPASQTTTTNPGNSPGITVSLAPSNLLVTVLSSDRIDLTWQDNSNNETGFIIERKMGTNGIFSQVATLGAIAGSGSGGFYENTYLTANTNYCYRISAYNSAGYSTYSNVSCDTTYGNMPQPTVSTGSANNITLNSVTLNGTVNPNGLSTGGFFQYGTTTSYGSTTASQVWGSGSSNISVNANITGLTANTTYHYRLMATTNNAGGTVFGADQTFTTGTSVNTTIVPSIPTANSPGTTSSPGTTISGNTATLSWSAVSGATYYNFGIRDMTTNLLVVDTISASTSFSATLSSGKQYRWNVAACNSAGCSSYTTHLYFQTPSSNAITAPSISSVSPNPVTGSNSQQYFAINGSNFVSGANIILRDLTAGQTFTNRVASSFSNILIMLTPTFTTAAHSWSVEVINPDGQSSGQYYFQVI